jgi:hypothetical protein
MDKLKLFIWEEFDPDYYPGLAFAIAQSEDAAKKLIEQEHGFKISDWGPVSIHPLNSQIGRARSGGG